MKIAIVDPSLFTLPYDVNLAKGLEANGHDVVIYGQNQGGQQETDAAGYLSQHFYPGFNSNFMRALPANIFLGLKGISHIESMFRLVYRLWRWRPDVIHFQWAPLAVIDKFFIPLFRYIAPTVLTVHDSTPFNNDPHPRFQRLNSIGIMRSFDHVIVHTSAAYARLLDLGLKMGKISIVPHGLLTPIVSDGDGLMPPDDRTLTLLMFGHIKHYKGVDVLIRALAALPDAVRSRCRVLIVGRPKMPMEPLAALVTNLGVSELVQFDLRFVPESQISGLMARADILMFPYREIDASGVLMIAIAAGRAIVASAIGLFDELLENGVHGALVPPDDPAALAAALKPLIEDRTRLREATRSVRKLAHQIPDWKTIGLITVDIYMKEIAQR